MESDIKKICSKLASINKKAYVIGSYCISRALGIKHTGDLDMATDALPSEVGQVLEVVGEVGKKYGTVIVKQGRIKVELTTFRKDIGSVNHRRPAEVEFTKDLTEDAARRDFTINAIYFDPLRDEFIDPFGGLSDLHSRTIRFVGKSSERLDEDILRILRFVRLKSKLKLTEADKSYHNLLKQRTYELKNISVERIKSELDKILLFGNAIDGLQMLKDIDFFRHFIPEVDDLSSTPGGPKHHFEGNVWIHTKMVIEKLKHYGCNDLCLYYAGLFHDIGKARTFSRDSEGNVHYYGHDKLGAEMFVGIAKRFKFSNEEINRIHYLISNHITIQSLLKMRKIKAFKFIMDKGIEDLILLCKADSEGKIPSKSDSVIDIEEFYRLGKAKLDRAEFVDGKYVLSKWPKLSGKAIGVKIEELNNTILNGL